MGSMDQASYFKQMDMSMQISQNNAMIVAYRQAGVPFHVEDTGVDVWGVVPDMPGATSH